MLAGIPPYEPEEIGLCLQRPTKEGGQDNFAQDAMIEVYSNIAELGLKVGGIDGVADAQDVIVRGLNAALPGAAVPNSEGLYYCVADEETNDDAFYWVQNCNILLVGASGNQYLCQGLTDDEAAVGFVGFVVDDKLTGSTDKVFVRCAFNSTDAIRTEVQPIEGSTSFSCSSRPWYEREDSKRCVDPASVLCPTSFVGSTGMGTFQVYGDHDVAVVAQDITTWQLCQCLDDLECEAETSAGGGS